MINWINRNKESIIRSAFLIPILSVAIISISHVVRWYDLANPMSWAIYLSIAVEIAALSSIAASSVRVKGFSVWFVFIIVTLIQFIGNIYFSYTEIDIASKGFRDWSELTSPIFEVFSDVEDTISQRRLLAVLEGGLLPLISLTCLHFFIKYGDRDLEKKEQSTDLDYTADDNIEDSKEIIEDYEKSDLAEESARVWNTVKNLKEEGKLPPDLTDEEKAEEPSALAFTPYLDESEPEIQPSVILQGNNSEKKEISRGVSLSKRSFDRK